MTPDEEQQIRKATRAVQQATTRRDTAVKHRDELLRAARHDGASLRALAAVCSLSVTAVKKITDKEGT